MTIPMQAALNFTPLAQATPEIILPTPLKAPLPANLSPVMAQYCQLKEEYSDSLLFFRLGDFYELFFDDAVTAARDMDIVLTKRGKNDGDDIPMCGVPAHAYETYLARLIQKGHKVAICEQVEDADAAKKRGAKGPLKREVVRVVTPGTLTEETLLSARQNNFLLAVSPLTKGDIGVAVIDLSTGTFFIESTDLKHLPGVLSRLNPVEIVLPDKLLQEPSLFEHLTQWKKKLSPLPQARFDMENCRKRLEEVYVVKTLDAFGCFSDAELRAAGALIDYIQLTQKSALNLIDRPRQLKNNQLMVIDPATRRSLELQATQSGQKIGSLLDTIDYTVTASGARTLSFYLSAPLTNAEQINQRLDSVEFLIQQANVRAHIRQMLKVCPDMERALSRLNLGRGNPRDLGAIRDGLDQAQQLKQSLSPLSLPLLLQKTLEKVGHFGGTVDKLARALGDSLPFQARDGNFIAPEYNSELDSFRYFRDHSKEHMAKLQEDYCNRTGITTLKIKHNNIIGYHIDVGVSHAQKIPDTFIHRQTMATSLRYTTPELGEIEKKIVSAAQQILELELKIFDDLVQDIKLQITDILACCRALSMIDVISALAELAVQQQYSRPVVDTSLTFDIQQGFHPIVAMALKKESQSAFVQNDCRFLEDQKIFLLTGPNMAGKSTYLRQNALIAILAQMGSYVPATAAHIGVVDRIFSRVGAADDLAAGRSTFMVEMVETAAILHQSTDRSFVILDEIGRGTATYDGLSLAWAVVEALATETKCRTLFATHYHELTQLEQTLTCVACKTMRIREWNDKVVFLHEVIPGAADKSYGIHVAALAGLPQPVIDRACQILKTLEAKEKNNLSIPEAIIASPSKPSVIERQLSTLDIDNLSPRDALEALYQLKQLLAK